MYLGRLTGKTHNDGDGGDGVQMSMVAVVPAVSRVGEVDDGVPLLLAITSASWSSSSAFRNVGEVRMETSAFGGTPARNPGDSGALQMGKKVKATVYCNRKSLGQKLGTEVVEIDGIELAPSSNGGGTEIAIRQPGSDFARLV